MIPVIAVLIAGVSPQDHSMHMPGMTMPAAPATAKPKTRTPRAATKRKPASGVPAAPPTTVDPIDHSQMDHSQTDHATTGSIPPATAGTGTDLPAGDAPAPPAPMAHAADRYWDPAAMAHARAVMMRQEGGGQTFAQVMLDLAETQVRNGRDGYRWDGEAWFGGDIHRAVVKSEGEGDVGGPLDTAEVQALYSRAIGPYFNLQAGVRHDIRPSPSRTYATIAVEGLAPYWFEVGAAAFVSTRGDVLARVEGYFDQRLTQRWILQPRVEVNLSAQDSAARGIGSGVSDAEIGLRLRYEIRRELAPYVGLSWERRLGDTARYARAAGDGAGSAALVLGLRGWF